MGMREGGKGYCSTFHSFPPRYSTQLGLPPLPGPDPAPSTPAPAPLSWSAGRQRAPASPSGGKAPPTPWPVATGGSSSSIRTSKTCTTGSSDAGKAMEARKRCMMHGSVDPPWPQQAQSSVCQPQPALRPPGEEGKHLRVRFQVCVGGGGDVRDSIAGTNVPQERR